MTAHHSAPPRAAGLGPGPNGDPYRRFAGPQAAQPSLQAVRELGTVGPMPKSDPDIHFLTIIGQIEGHIALPPKNKTTKYEHVIPQLAALEQDDRIRGVLVLLNTVGGDIEAGLALAEMIRGLSKPTVSLVLGGGHSIGAPIAVAADYTFIAPTATMTIHPVRLTGMLIGVPQTYEYLDKMQDRIIRFIVANSRISESRLREVMFRTGELMRDVGTVLVGREAVDIGLIDEVGSIAAAIARLRYAMATGQRKQTPWPPPSAAAPAPLPSGTVASPVLGRLGSRPPAPAWPSAPPSGWSRPPRWS